MPDLLTIVVADDTVDVLVAISEGLSLLGHTVHRACDGVEAVDQIRRVHPHVAILDIGMPGLDGVAVATEVRRDPNLKDVRLVAHSGFTRPVDRARAFSAGFDDYIDKPAELRRLLDALQA